jgi:glycerol-3-phosphate dehydrogenase (NAD(P)+)
MGLAGLGDMMLTANSMTSRNTSLGFELGQGRALAEVLRERERTQVTEGAASTGAVAALARQLDVRMPVTFALDSVLNGGVPLDAAIAAFMGSLPAASPPRRP